MSATMEKISSNKVRFTFAVPAEKFEEGVQRAYRKLAKRFNIPGFRRGKAPLRIIENYYGASVFYEDALDEIFPEIYTEAIEENGVQVVSRPDVNVTQIGHGKELQFTVEAFIVPDVELGEYKNLGIEKHVNEVTEDDVNAEVQRALDRASRYVPVTDRPAQLDDQVNIDYAGFLGEEQFDGGTAQGHDLVLGSGSFIPGFEEQLVGANNGDQVDVNVTFPEDYHEKKLAGKPVVFHVTVNSIQQKETPKLDDDFAQDSSESANTVEEYKNEIRDRLVKKAETDAENAFEQELLDTVCENATVDIPEAMVLDQCEAEIDRMRQQLAMQGMKLEDYLKYTGMNHDSLVDMYKPNAEQNVRTQLVLEAIRKAEAIEPTDEEIEAEIDEYATNAGLKPETVRGNMSEGTRERFKDIAASQKVLNFLKENNA